jgi:hypothetical protein
MQLCVHAAKLRVQWFTTIRDQVPSIIRYLPDDIMRPSKSTTQKILHAFYNARICSQHDIMYISYNILLCLPCRGPDLDCAAGQVGFNSDYLASSTIAHDYFYFARTLDYTSQTTPTTRQIRLRLVGLIASRRQLLDFVKNARRHASDYFDYSFHLQG